MSRNKQLGKLNLVREHRLNYYLSTLEKLINGEVKLEYVTQRFNKLKAVKK